MCPILPIWTNYLLEDRLDFSITLFYLPIRLGVVWRGDAAVYSVFLQQRPKVRTVEVCVVVADDSPRTTVSGEDTSRDESQNSI